MRVAVPTASCRRCSGSPASRISCPAIGGAPRRCCRPDYSCALKLATPVAFKSAMYGAGRSGILIKGASTLERLAEADTFIFDKTGRSPRQADGHRLDRLR